MLMVLKKGNLEAAFEASTDDGQNYDQSTGMVLIIVRPGMEQTARDSLRRAGIGAWWPNYKREAQAKDRMTGQRYTKLVLAGVLPGIVLTPSRLNRQFWAAIDLAPGAINIIRKLDGDALVIDDTAVVLIHKIEAELNKPSPAETVHNFEVGQEVVITGDLMRNFVAKIERIDGRRGFVHLEIPMFGRAVPMTVLASQIAHV